MMLSKSTEAVSTLTFSDSDVLEALRKYAFFRLQKRGFVDAAAEVWGNASAKVEVLEALNAGDKISDEWPRDDRLRLFWRRAAQAPAQEVAP